MTVADIERITKVLESMIQYELSLSDFYKQCADILTSNVRESAFIRGPGDR